MFVCLFFKIPGDSIHNQIIAYLDIDFGTCVYHGTKLKISMKWTLCGKNVLTDIGSRVQTDPSKPLLNFI